MRERSSRTSHGWSRGLMCVLVAVAAAGCGGGSSSSSGGSSSSSGGSSSSSSGGSSSSSGGSSSSSSGGSSSSGASPTSFAYPLGSGYSGDTSCYVGKYGVDPATSALRALDGESIVLAADDASPCYLLTAAPSGRFIYTVRGLHDRALLAGLAVDPATGALSPVPGDPPDIGPGWLPSDYISSTPIALTVDPAGRFLYVVFTGYYKESHVDAYAIADDGAVAFVARTDMPAIYNGDVQALFTSDGGLLLVGAAAHLTVFQVTPATGALKVANNLDGLAAQGLYSATYALDSTGRRLFVGFRNSATSVIQSYDLAGDGTVTVVPHTLLDAQGYYVQTMLVGPWDDVLYLGGQRDGSLAAYSIGETGALTLVPGSASIRRMGFQLVFDPSGRVLYDVDGSDVTAAAISADTGAILGELAGSPFARDSLVPSRFRMVLVTPTR